MIDSISERIIEDIFTADKSILANVLSVSIADLSFIARQKILKTGNLDMLYLDRDEILLIELKVVPFYRDIVIQINNYENDLIELQLQNKLINAGITKILMVTSATDNDRDLCLSHNIRVIVYKPETVLSMYYENFRELSAFLTIQSADFGVVRLGLIKTTLRHLGRGVSLSEISNVEGRSGKTIRNKVSIAERLNLVSKFKETFFLTEMGIRFVEYGDEACKDGLSNLQIQLLSDFLKENPFYSSTTYTIYSLIESVFVLSKNSYPVPKEQLKDFFVKSVGKTATWKTEKSKETATYIFSNYARELEFIVTIGNQYYITPKGIQAILLLQLNRSIKLIQSRS